MSNTKTLCNMAWDYPMFFMFTNSIGYCCRTPKIPIDDNLLDELGEDFWSNHPKFVERRRALLDGIKHSDCNTCWKLEDAGFKSSRTDLGFRNFMKKNYKDLDLKLPYSQFKNVPGLERSNYSNCIEIVLNNTCDAKCTYCSEFYSTQWLTEKKKFNEVSRNYTPQDRRNPKAEKLFWSWYENKAIKTNRRFGFIGGEPLIIDALYECFDKLIEIHDRTPVEIDPIKGKVELCITSNLNTPPAYFQKLLDYIPRLEKHFKIIIQVSGENVGADLEYVRYGVKWDRWSSNIEYLLKNTSVTVGFLPCLNLLSIPRFYLYLEYFMKLCREYRFMNIHHNIVTHPIEQSPMIAPKEFSVYFDRCIEIMQELISENTDENIGHAYSTFLNWLEQTQEAITKNPSENEVTENSKKFYNFFTKLDARRRTNVIEIIPELKTFFDMGKPQ